MLLRLRSQPPPHYGTHAGGAIPTILAPDGGEDGGIVSDALRGAQSHDDYEKGAVHETLARDWGDERRPTKRPPPSATSHPTTTMTPATELATISTGTGRSVAPPAARRNPTSHRPGASMHRVAWRRFGTRSGQHHETAKIFSE